MLLKQSSNWYVLPFNVYVHWCYNLCRARTSKMVFLHSSLTIASPPTDSLALQPLQSPDFKDGLPSLLSHYCTTIFWLLGPTAYVELPPLSPELHHLLTLRLLSKSSSHRILGLPCLLYSRSFFEYSFDHSLILCSQLHKTCRASSPVRSRRLTPENCLLTVTRRLLLPRVQFLRSRQVHYSGFNYLISKEIEFILTLSIRKFHFCVTRFF